MAAYRTVTAKVSNGARSVTADGTISAPELKVIGEVAPVRIVATDVSLSADSFTASADVSDRVIPAVADIEMVRHDYDGEIYAGGYEVTPADEQQVLATAGTYLTKNVVVKKIPSNYGKITWNGVVLRIT